MAWEERGAHLYYYQSERAQDGKVKKRYIGVGEIAEAVARADETRRAARQERRERGREELEHLEALTAPALEIDQAAAVLASAQLLAAGYRRHKGEWRLQRERS